MSKRSVVSALVLITVGIVFGALLVSNFSGGVGPGFATDQDPKLGGPRPLQTPGVDLTKANQAFVEIAKAVTPTVVSITVTSTSKGSNIPQDFFHFFSPDGSTPEPQPSQGAGSGIIITADGYIATNNHVVEGADKGGIEVILNDKSRYKAKIIGTDPTTDLAVIKIEGKGLTAAAIGNSDDVQVGEWVLAIGNPLGLNSTVTAGIVSAIGRGGIGVISRTEAYGIENFIQTDAAINPGNSGGALVNIYGEVIGINTAIATTNARYQGYGFAVPSNLIKVVARDLIRDGKVRRGYIGVSIQAVDQTMAKAVGLPRAQGVIVQSVVKDGAAESAGVLEKDIILSVDSREVNQANELQSYVASRRPGDVVTLKLYRDGKNIEKKVTLKPRNDESDVITASNNKDETNETDKDSPEVADFDKLGMSVRAMTDGEQDAAKVDHGVVVASVKPYSEAFERNIREKLVILEADNKPVRSPKDLKKIFEGKKPGDSVLLRMKSPSGASFFTAVEIPSL